MEKKFTTGEWRVVHELNVECDRRSIATCGFNSSDQNEMAKSKWNAKLIAAAPDLLDAIRYYIDVLDEVRGNTWREHPDHVTSKFLSVYKKATE